MMFFIPILLSAVLLSRTLATATGDLHRFSQAPRSQTTGCELLSKQYPLLTSFPNSTIYETENTAFWSESTILSPECIFTPNSTQHVSWAVQILVKTKTRFAVRGGGHMPIPGAASTNNGALIAMDHLNTINLIEGKTVARIGAGNRWSDVYGYLATYELTVVAGRYATVGVGGYMLGGGISYYISARGWAVDHIVNYEIVAADGEIMQVNATSNADLFWALKGGSNNFGIATRFDLETFPLTDIYAGFLTSNASYVDQTVQAVADYVSPPTGGTLDQLSAIDTSLEFTLDTRELTAVTNLFYNQSVETPPEAFENFTKIPTITASTAATRSLMSFLNETIVDGDRNENKLFGATGLNCTADAVHLMAQSFRENIQNISYIAGGIVTITFQPIAQSSLEAAIDAGGDAIDLDPENGPVMAVLVSGFYDDASDTEYMQTWLSNLLKKIDEKAKSAGIYYPFAYLNDSGEGQKPFSFYGRGKSLAKMRATAAKYDPEGVFQTLLAGAFKL